MSLPIPPEARDALLDAFLQWYIRERAWDRSWRGHAHRWRQPVGTILAAVTSLFGFALGVWLVLPLDTFASGPAFVGLRVLPEWWWGLAMVTAATVSLVSLWRGYRLARLLSSTAKGFCFVAIALSAGAGTDWRTTGVPVYGVLALLSFAAFWLAPAVGQPDG